MILMILKLAINMISTKREKSARRGGDVGVMFTLQEIYDLAIQIEKNGEDFFREAEKKTSKPTLKSLFLWLAEQEVKHSKWFMQKKASSKVESEPLAMDEITGNMLKDILGDQRFSLGEVEIDRLKTVEDLLSVAMEFEEDTIIFFRMVRSLLDDDDSMKGLDEIIEEETNHIQMLRDFRDEGEQDLVTIKEKT